MASTPFPVPLAEAGKRALGLVATGRMGTWSVETTAVWLASGCRCAYCRRDLLADRDTAYHFAHVDHLPPSTRYPRLSEEPTNRVLACSPCNIRKKNWDPAQALPGEWESKERLSEQERLDLVIATRGHLASGAPARESQFDAEQKLFRGAMARDRP